MAKAPVPCFLINVTDTPPIMGIELMLKSQVGFGKINIDDLKIEPPSIAARISAPIRRFYKRSVVYT